MDQFLKTQWRDIAGNVKFWLITVFLGGLMGLVAILTHCLKWWQQAGLATIFGILLACAVAAAFYALKGRSPAGTRPSGPLLIQYAGYGLGVNAMWT